MTSEECNEFIENKMTEFFPIGCKRDRSAETPAGQLPAEPIRDPQEVEKILLPEAVANAEAANFKAESEIFQKELK